MSLAEATDIAFTGAAIVPGFLAYADQPTLAMAALVVLVIAGAVCSLGDPAAPHRKPPHD